MRPTLDALYTSYFNDTKDIFVLKYGEANYNDVSKFVKMFKQVEEVGVHISLRRQSQIVNTSINAVIRHRDCYIKHVK